MNEQTLLNTIRQNLKKDISDTELETLLKATTNSIDSILEEGYQLEINDFGTFSRRKNNSISTSFFKPAERLHERINRKK